jgi:hypothetical protein
MLGTHCKHSPLPLRLQLTSSISGISRKRIGSNHTQPRTIRSSLLLNKQVRFFSAGRPPFDNGGPVYTGLLARVGHPANLREKYTATREQENLAEMRTLSALRAAFNGVQLALMAAGSIMTINEAFDHALAV